MMIPHEQKQSILSHLYQGTGRNHSIVPGFRVSSEITTDTLLYSWGNAKNGKLGISNNYFSELADGDNHTQFFCDENVANNDSLPELGDNATIEEIEARQNLIEFNYKQVFTAVP